MPDPLVVPRTSLFKKYFRALFAATIVPLLIAGGSEAWFGYHDQRARLNDLLNAEARFAAVKIHDFIEGIRDQLGWTVQLPWAEDTGDRRRLDALRLLRQVPAVESLRLVDAAGKERLFVSRIGLNRIESGDDLSKAPSIAGARAERIWFGPVTFHGGSEPFMTVALAGSRAADGVAVAEVNLKFIWEVISGIRVGRTGDAFVLDRPGRLVADPDISLVLRADEAEQRPLQALRTVLLARPGQAAMGRDIAGHKVLAAMAQIPDVGWNVIVKQPLAEAFAPIYAALWRTAALLVAGGALAAALAYGLTQRMIGPIRVLEEGVARIGAGQFDHRINIATGDEFERLATRFNEMASELAASREKSERIDRLKRFLAPQVAELVERSGNEGLLAGQRHEVVAIFGDLRGFTAFSTRAEPDIIMAVLAEYYEALGAVIARHEATLTGFSGDGVMVLVNAPVVCQDPAQRGIQLAIDMQAAVQSLILRWRAGGHAIGFGVGIAMGTATVGTVGYEGRMDYTAIGNVINLASRLCGSATDAQILVDPVVAEAVKGHAPLVFLGNRFIKGYDRPLEVFAVAPVASVTVG